MLEEHPNSEKATPAKSDGSEPVTLDPLIKPAPDKERRHAAFFDVISSSLTINTPEQFCAWVQGDLQHIFPHGMMACGVGLIENLGGRIQQIITCNFPQSYLQGMQQPGGMINSPVISQWVKTRRPVLFEMSEQHGTSPWLKNFKCHGLKNMAAHGQCDLRSRTTSYFSFSRIPGKLTLRHAALLDLLVPHLHAALTRALNGADSTSLTAKKLLPDLSIREHEILQMLGSGKTNSGIAQALHISENTVRNHVQHILAKLKVKTRAEAVAKGLFPG